MPLRNTAPASRLRTNQSCSSASLVQTAELRPKVVWFYVLGGGATLCLSAIGFFGWASPIDGRLAAAGVALYALALLVMTRWLRGQTAIEERTGEGVSR